MWVGIDVTYFFFFASSGSVDSLNQSGQALRKRFGCWGFVLTHHLAKFHKTPHIQNRFNPSILLFVSFSWLKKQHTHCATGRNRTRRGYRLPCTFSPRFSSPKLHSLLRKWYLNEGKKLLLLFYRVRHLARLSSTQLCSRRAITGRRSKMCEVWIVKVTPVPYGGSLKDVKRKLLIASMTLTL